MNRNELERLSQNHNLLNSSKMRIETSIEENWITCLNHNSLNSYY